MATIEWTLLGDVFYRKLQIYNMKWPLGVDLQKYSICASPYSGPIALINDLTTTGKSSPGDKPYIHICSCSGSEISTIKWSSGKIIKMDWSNREELLCVQDDGTVLVYSILGKFIKSFSMGKDAKESKVLDCRIFNTTSATTGLAVLTTYFKIFLISNIHNVRIYKLAEIPGSNIPPSTWTVINYTGLPRVLVAKEMELYFLDLSSRCEKLSIPSSTPIVSFIEMSPSFNNKYVALFTSTGLLWIGSSDLKNCHCELETGVFTRPKQLAWCGTGAVICHWDNYILVVGATKDQIKYYCKPFTHFVAEMDGLRMIGNGTHDILQKVPSASEDVFKIGSIAPGALLYKASTEFKKQSQQSSSYLRLLGNDMAPAIKTCLDAVGFEFDTDIQKALLTATSFGKTFLEGPHSDEFEWTCRHLRVLHALWKDQIGIPITLSQMKHLGVDILIDRLLNRRLFWLANEICQYLRLPDLAGVNRVLICWACDKIAHSYDEDDKTLASSIANKIAGRVSLSYSKIVDQALTCKRDKLAIHLIDFEPRISEQVELLLKLNEEGKALQKALKSGDSDLVYLVIAQWKDSISFGELIRALRSYPTAFSLFLQLCREQNPTLLVDLYNQDDNHLDEALCRVSNSYNIERFEERLSNLVAAQDSFAKAKLEIYTKTTEDQIKLLKYQRQYEDEFRGQFIDLSLNQTLVELIKFKAADKLIDQLRKDFKVTDKCFWWLKIGALSTNQNWTELERFSKSKKSPIGYEPFIEVCIKGGSLTDAMTYIGSAQNENMVKYYLKIGEVEKAADKAIQLKSPDDLNSVLNYCGTLPAYSSIVSRINNAKVK